MRLTADYLRTRILALPPAIDVSEAQWSSTPVLRAFFASASEVPAALGRSHNLRTFFARFPDVSEAFIVFGMTYQEQHVEGALLQGDVLQRDIAQRVVDFSSPNVRICGHSETEVKHLLGNQSFEYLVAQAMREISELRSERQELEESRSLIRARLRMLQMQGPGLGSVFATAPAGGGAQQVLESQLLDNERQLSELGDSQAILETELDYLCKVLGTPERYIRFEPTHLRLSTLNVILDASRTEMASDVEFTMAVLDGVPKTRRAFVIGRVKRSDVPSQRIDWANAERLL
ncbi:hypothetical protein [Propionivibrio dicarboxylicus]|uniref:hypothetical protein n=1 Tax=Propionivibrio dicarboxylicus TaxID=83767 RepID=UPI001C40B3EB|nr:hypothetical protein [Propionivibrio dicarboxylicus]